MNRQIKKKYEPIASIKRRANIEGVEVACKSQLISELYESLKNKNKLTKFLAIVQYASAKDMSKEEFVRYAIEKMPVFLNTENFNIVAFDKMLKWHIDVSESWGFGKDGDEIRDVMLKNRAFDIAVNTDDIKNIAVYRNIYNSGETSNNKGKDNEFIFNIN